MGTGGSLGGPARPGVNFAGNLSNLGASPHDWGFAKKYPLINSRAYIHTHTHPHADTHSHIHTQTHTHTFTRRHTLTHTHTHTRNAPTHTHIHIFTPRSLALLAPRCVCRPGNLWPMMTESQRRTKSLKACQAETWLTLPIGCTGVGVCYSGCLSVGVGLCYCGCGCGCVSV